MLRRIKRTKDFEVSLNIRTDDFINPPRTAQRNWLLNRALLEFSSDLSALDNLAKRFVTGSGDVDTRDRGQERLEKQEIMEDWQIPVMKKMAGIVAETHGDVLEVGFGRGVSSELIQDQSVKSHIIIECNDYIIEDFHRWKADKYPDRNIHIVHGMWQDVIGDLGTFDGVFFHTYPLNEGEHQELVVKSATFAEHFFPHAKAHLVEGGIFTYLTNEIDSFSRAHQRAVFNHFTELTLCMVRDLALPENCLDTLWADSMIVAKVIK